MIGTKKQTWSGFGRLAIGVIALMWIWLCLLPRIGQIDPVNKMIQRHRESGIDPSIMFYTEIDHLEYRDGMLRQKIRSQPYQ